MVTYDPAVFGLTTYPLTNASTISTGQRESTLDEGEWVSEPLPKCVNCPAHVSEGGTHATVGRHYCNANVSASPLIPAQQFPFEFVRRMQNFLSYQNWLVNGWRAANPDFMINGGAMNNFATWYVFKIVAASGRVLTLECGEIDPRNVTAFFATGRSDVDDPFSPLATSHVGGMWCQVGDQVDIGGNSVLAGRVSCRIVEADFSALTDYPADPETQITITVDQDISNAPVKMDPDSDDEPKVWIYREAFQPEQWQSINDPAPLACLFKTVEIPKIDVPVDGIITLLDGADADTRIAYPIADNEAPPGTSWASNVRRTFKLEIDNGTGYQDVDLRTWAGNPFKYEWIRIGVTHEGTTGYQTKLYLGVVGPRGQVLESLITDALVSIRIYYGYEVSGLTVEGARSPCQRKCGNDTEDLTQTVGSIDTNGVDIVGGRHHYCAARATTPKANLDEYRGNNCFQLGTCPNFIPAAPGAVNAYTWAQLYCEQNTKLIQIFAGSSNAGNFAIVRNSNPSFHWLANPAEVYDNPRGFYAWTEPFTCGGFGFWATFVGGGLDDADQNIIFMYGAIYNYSSPGRGYAEFPALIDAAEASHTVYDMRGLFARLTTLVSHTQIDNTAYPATNLEERMRNWWRGIQAAVPVHKEARELGPTVSFSNRSIAGIEGQNRVQRFNRSTVAFIPKIDKSINTPQPHVEVHHAIIGAGVVDGFNYGLEIRLRADGAIDYGAKRLGGSAITVPIKRVESMGGGLYTVHCMVGPWYVSNGVMGGDEINVFYGGGNVVQLTPEIHGVRGHYNSINDKTHGGPFMKAIPGDTIKIVSHPGISRNESFWILEAKPCNGDSVVGLPATNWMEFYSRPGVYFDPPANVKEYEITKFEVAFTTGTGAYQEFPILKSSSLLFQRPVSDDFSDIGLLWDHEDLGTDVKMIQYFVSPTEGDTISFQLAAGGTEYIYEFINPMTEYTGMNIPVGIGVAPDYTYYNLAEKLNSANPLVTAYVDRDNDTITFVPRGDAVTITNTLGLPVMDVVKFAGSNAAFISYASYWWAAMNGDVAERKCKITFLADGVGDTLEKDIEGCFLTLEDADTSSIGEWIVGSFGPDGAFVTYEYLGNVTSNFNFDVPMASFVYNVAAGTIVFHPNESGKVIYVRYKVTTPIDLGDFPPSRDYPPREGEEEGIAYLKNCDTLLVRSEDGIFEDETLTGMLLEVHTDGVIKPGATVTVEWSEFESETWTEVPSGDLNINYARGRIRISPTYLATIPDIFCVKVSTSIANRTPETPAELALLTLEHANALDTVIIGSPFNNGFYFSMSGFYMFGSPAWTDWSGGKYPTSIVTGWHYGDESGVAGSIPFPGLNYPDFDRTTLLYGSAAPGGYPKTIKRDEGVYSEGSGNIEDYPVFIGADTTSGALGGELGYPEKYIPCIGGGAGMAAHVFFVEFKEFLKRIPTDAEIVSAHCEVRIVSDDPEKPARVTKTVRNLVVCQSDVEEYVLGVDPRDSWVVVSNPDEEDTSEELTEGIPCGFGLMGLTNEDHWVYLGNFIDVGAVMSTGRKMVVSCKAFVEQLIALRSSSYKQIGMLVSPNSSASSYVPSDMPGSRKFRTIVSGIKNSFEQIQSLVGGSIDTWYFPHTIQDVMGTSEHAIENNGAMYHIKVTHTAYRFEADAVAVGNLVITYKLPDSSIETKMAYGNFPPMHPITT